MITPGGVSIWLTGMDGSHWDLAGPNAGFQGVELAPRPQWFIDAPAKTYWVQTNAGFTYQTWRPDQRRPLFIVRIAGTDMWAWHDTDSRFRLALGMYDDQFTLNCASADGTRTLTCQLYDAPKAYETEQWEGKDPHLFCESTLVISAACSDPYWEDTPYVTTWQSPGDGSGTITLLNNGDVESWPRWQVTAPGTWTIPDFSWGNTYWGNAAADAARTVTLPTLQPGEGLDIDTDPKAVAPWAAANGAPVWYRSHGRMNIYPISRRTPATVCPISVADTIGVSVAQVTVPQRYSRPWGVTG